MCRFVAVIARENMEMRKYLEFLKRQASNGKRSPHGDGFGYWILGDSEYFYHSTTPVWKHTIPIPNGRIAFLHARKRGKTGAPIEINNVHPFIYQGSVFMHNGIVDMPRHPKASGTTDTESYFLTLLDMGIERGLKYIAKYHEFSSLNFVMYKNEEIHIFRLANKLPDYFTIFIKESEKHILISTESDGSEWREVKNGELIRISNELNIHSNCIFPDRCH
jgi:glutamine amidotransferase